MWNYARVAAVVVITLLLGAVAVAAVISFHEGSHSIRHIPERMVHPQVYVETALPKPPAPQPKTEPPKEPTYTHQAKNPETKITCGAQHKECIWVLEVEVKMRNPTKLPVKFRGACWIKYVVDGNWKHITMINGGKHIKMVPLQNNRVWWETTVPPKTVRTSDFSGMFEPIKKGTTTVYKYNCWFDIVRFKGTALVVY